MANEDNQEVMREYAGAALEVQLEALSLFRDEVGDRASDAVVLAAWISAAARIAKVGFRFAGMTLTLTETVPVDKTERN